MWGVMQVIFASLVGWGVGDGCSVRLVVRVDVPLPTPSHVVCAVPGRSTAAALSRTGRSYPCNNGRGKRSIKWLSRRGTKKPMR
jgi:hypothetical protein